MTYRLLALLILIQAFCLSDVFGHELKHKSSDQSDVMANEGHSDR